jgi:vacuolar-type H+-ATPase subunit H
MILRRIAVLIFLLLLSACAQVPKESLELSVAVGRDMQEIKKSHIALLNLHFDVLERNINRFVDDVYAPYQIQKTLEDYKDRLTSAIQRAALPNSGKDAQNNAIGLLSAYLEELRQNIEEYRASKLNPVKTQRSNLLATINQSYANVETANAAINGYLSSLLKVRDLQNDLLAKLGAPNLQDQVAQQASDLSAKLETLIKAAQKGEVKVDEAIKRAEGLLTAAKK